MEKIHERVKREGAKAASKAKKKMTQVFGKHKKQIEAGKSGQSGWAKGGKS